MSGWIKIHRDILYHEIWSDKPFSKGQAWIDLILLANHSDNKCMRQELEELTGDKIEIEPSREEMIGKIKLYCSERTICTECVLKGMNRCNYWKFDSETLKQCYEKVMEDVRKEM